MHLSMMSIPLQLFPKLDINICLQREAGIEL